MITKTLKYDNFNEQNVNTIFSENVQLESDAQKVGLEKAIQIFYES